MSAPAYEDLEGLASFGFLNEEGAQGGEADDGFTRSSGGLSAIAGLFGDEEGVEAGDAQSEASDDTFITARQSLGGGSRASVPALPPMTRTRPNSMPVRGGAGSLIAPQAPAEAPEGGGGDLLDQIEALEGPGNAGSIAGRQGTGGALPGSQVVASGRVPSAHPSVVQAPSVHPSVAQVPSAHQSVAQAQPPAPAAKQNLAPTQGWRPDGKAPSGGRLDAAVNGLGIGSEAFEVVENATELVNTGATSAMQLLDNAGALGSLTSNVEGALATGESIGNVAEQVGDYINPIKGFTGAPIETNNLIKTGADLLNIRKFQRNEGKTLAANTHAREIDQDNDREAIKATKQNLGQREDAQARQLAAFAARTAVNARGLGADVEAEAQSEVSAATRARWKALGQGVTSQNRLKAIAKQGGYRMENESSMEQSAYNQDKKLIARAPVGMDAADIGRGMKASFGADDSRAPEVGMLEKDEKGRIVLDANGLPKRAEGKGSAITGRQDDPSENRLANLSADDFAKGGAVPGEGAFNDRRAGYRYATAAGRAKQKRVRAARFIQGAGRLLDGTLDTDAMVNDGEYGKAYAAKAAELGVNIAGTAGIDALNAAAPAAGPIAAPLIGVTGAAKEVVEHAKGELGRGLGAAGRGLESLLDSQGLAKEQDLKDERNTWLGYSDPQPQAPAQAPAQGQAAGQAQAAAQAQPAGPVHDPGMSRAERAAVYGVDFKDQGDENVVGRRRRTWGRALFDNTLGLAGKAVTGSARALWGVGKGVYQGAKWAGGKVASGAKWMWNKMRGERDGDMARRDLELLRQYKDTSDGEMPAEGAFSGKLGMLGAEDLKYQREWQSLSAADRAEYKDLEDRHRRLYGIGNDGKREDAQGNRIVGDRERLLADVAAKAPTSQQAAARNAEKDQLRQVRRQAGQGAGQDKQDAVDELIRRLEEQAQKKQAMARSGTIASNAGGNAGP